MTFLLLNTHSTMMTIPFAPAVLASWYASCEPGLQESSLSAFSQWKAAASGPDLPAFLADTALVRTALLSISQAQATASQLAKTIADKTEAGMALIALPAACLWAGCLTALLGPVCSTSMACSESAQHVLTQVWSMQSCKMILVRLVRNIVCNAVRRQLQRQRPLRTMRFSGASLVVFSMAAEYWVLACFGTSQMQPTAA